MFFDDSDEDTADLAIALNFADDKKLMRIIKSVEDTHILQNAIDKFINWCSSNSLQVNASKCKVITLSHKKTPIITDYFINELKVERVYEIRDLGVIINAKMNPNAHIEFMKKKSLAALSFVRRTCRNEFHIDTAKLLYTSLVRSNVEFANVVWNPHTKERKMPKCMPQALIYKRDWNSWVSIEKTHSLISFGLDRDAILSNVSNRIKWQSKSACNSWHLTSRISANIMISFDILHI